MDLLAADDHIAKCEQCREKLGATVPVAQAWQTLRASLASESQQPEHLSYEELAAYVDEKLSGVQREAVESHGRPQSVLLTVPPLATVFLQWTA